MSSHTWQSMNDVFYRKTELYILEWRLDLNRHMVVMGPNCGPVAAVLDDRKLQPFGSTVNSRTIPRGQIHTFNGAGERIGQINYDASGGEHLVDMAWTEGELLLLVFESGLIRVHNMHGAFVTEFSFGREVEAAGVVDSRIFGTGVVVLTRDWRFFAVLNLENPRPKQVSEGIPGMDTQPMAWTIIEPIFTHSRQLEIVVAYDSTIYVIDFVNCQDQMLTHGPYVQMTLSPDRKLISLLNDTGQMYVTTSDFMTTYSEFNTQSKEQPRQMCWCANDAVAAEWNGSLLIIGPYGDWIKYEYDPHDAIQLFSERDGLRIISGYGHEFFEKVPSALVNALRIGSAAPAALLYDAAALYHEGNPRCDSLMRLILFQEDSTTDAKADGEGTSMVVANGTGADSAKLTEAVEDCISCATQEWEASSQKKFLQAAAFGKGYMEFYFSGPFVNASKYLRVLNALRHLSVGYPLSYGEFQDLGLEAVISRLLERHHHLLAFRICEWMNMDLQGVLDHWACLKTQESSALSDDEVAQLIFDKMDGIRGISFRAVSEAAWKNGRTRLASKLIEKEPRASLQVPQLLRMGEHQLALKRAAASGDPDLILYAALQIKRVLPLAEYLKLLGESKLTADTVLSYAKESDLGLVSDILYQTDRKQESIHMMFEELQFKRAGSTQERMDKLKVMSGMYQEIGNNIDSKILEDEIRLLNHQKDISRSTGIQLDGYTLNQTVLECIINGMSKKADDLRKEFKIPEKRFWYLKARGLSQKRDWVELEKFCKSKSKSPIGYVPFAEGCINCGNVPEAEKYIVKCGLEDQAHLYLKCKNWEEAVNTATQARSTDLLRYIKRSLADEATQNHSLTQNALDRLNDSIDEGVRTIRQS
eukprot:Clim_evm9s22 gene=Clim_evmTU9s22